MKKIILVSIILLQAMSARADLPAAVTFTAAGDVFPYLQAQALDDKYITLPYNTTKTAQVSYIILTYKRPDDKDMETWVRPFKEKYDGNTRAAHYSIAMIGDIGFINMFIFNGMKGSATPEMKDHLLVFFHDKEPYKKMFGVADDSLIFVYIVDQKGVIRLAKSGRAASKEDIIDIMKAIDLLLKPEKNPK